MENNERGFTYLEQYLVALEDLTPEERNEATYALCYYGVYEEFPEGISAISKMYVKTNIKMVQNNIDYRNQKQIQGKKGATARIASMEDSNKVIAHMIIEAIAEGREPSSKEIGDVIGRDSSTVRKRKPWGLYSKFMGPKENLTIEYLLGGISDENFLGGGSNSAIKGPSALDY